MANTNAYWIDADMIGQGFTGSLSDLSEFIEILAEQTDRPADDFELRQHVGNNPLAEEPSEHDWNEALAEFAERKPELFS